MVTITSVAHSLAALDASTSPILLGKNLGSRFIAFDVKSTPRENDSTPAKRKMDHINQARNHSVEYESMP